MQLVQCNKFQRLMPLSLQGKVFYVTTGAKCIKPGEKTTKLSLINWESRQSRRSKGAARSKGINYRLFSFRNQPSPTKHKIQQRVNISKAARTGFSTVSHIYKPPPTFLNYSQTTSYSHPRELSHINRERREAREWFLSLIEAKCEQTRREIPQNQFVCIPRITIIVMKPGAPGLINISDRGIQFMQCAPRLPGISLIITAGVERRACVRFGDAFYQ